MSGLLFPSAACLLQQKIGSVDEVLENASLTCNESLSTKSMKDAYICLISQEDKFYNEEKDVSWESDSSTHKKKKKSVKKKRRKEEKKKRKKSHKNDKKKDIFKPAITWLENTTLTIKDAHRKDTQGDGKNLEFNGLYNFDIPSYHKKLNFLCVGLGSKHFQYFPQYRKKRNHNDVDIRYFKNQCKVKQLNFSDQNIFPNHVESKEFLPVSTAYEAITDSNKNDFIGTAYLEENKRFSQLLLEQPENEKAWLDFVDYQDLLCSCDELCNSSSKVVLEKKASILEKGIAQNPISVRLIIKYMNTIKHIWTSDKLYTKWKDLIFQFPNKTLIWQEYLLFMQSDLLSNKVSKVITEYGRCFRMLSGILNGTVRSHKAEVGMLQGVISIYVQLVCYLWLAGYSEKATCMLYCIIEYNLASPNGIDDETHKLKLFEEFYNKSLPRLGESGAVHWNSSEKFKNISVIKFHQSLQELSFDVSLEAFKSSIEVLSKDKIWLSLEKIRSLLDILPFQTDLDSCEDPERVIFFEDVSSTLFTVPSKQLSFQFVLTYLFLLGVSIPADMLNFLECYQRFFMVKECPRFCLCHTKYFSNYVCIDSVLFNEDKLTKSTVKLVREIFCQSIGLISDRNIIELSQIWLHFETSLFCIEFENTSKELDKKYWKEISKFIKSLLKLPSNRSSVALWDMYATFEWNLGNIIDSKNIFFTAIQLIGNDKKHGIYHCATITRNLIELHVDIKKPDMLSHKKRDIQWLFVAFVEPNQRPSETCEVSHVILLKIFSSLKQTFSEIIRELRQSRLLNTPFSMIQDFLCCFILFEYLYNGPNVLQERFSELFSLPPNVVKCLPDAFVYMLVLFNNFCLSTHLHFSKYKNMILSCMEFYGGHRIFNELFISTYRHGFNSLHARRCYEKIIKANPYDINLWLNAVKYEEARLAFINCKKHTEDIEVEFLEPSCGLHNRIRSLYGRMTQEETIMYCADVWISYIRFQLQHGTLKQAKDVFYSSLRRCPCVKALYIFACEKLDEFNQLFELMVEKEIRIKVIMEELDVLLEN